MLRSHVINLDRHQGRMRFMAAQLDALGAPWARFPAVNGYDPAAIAGADVAAFADLSQGEIGAWESHRGVWREIVQSGAPAIVLEDDVALASDFGQLDVAALPGDADIVKLDYFRRPSEYGARAVAIGGAGRVARRLVGGERLASAYLATPAGAARLLAGSRRYFEPVDELVFRPHSRLFWDLRIWKAMPALAAQLRHVMPQETLPRDIADGIQSRTRMTGTDPKRRPGALAQARLRLRRVLDGDTGAQRARRAARGRAAFARAEAIAAAHPAFHTPDRGHVDRALAAMHDETGGAA